MKKTPWVSEDEMYEILESNNHKLLGDALNIESDNFTIFSQYKINNRNERPDYIVLSTNHNKHILHLVEVKITADISVVGQLKKYHNTLFDIIACNYSYLKKLEIRKAVIAKFVDVSLIPYLEDGYGIDLDINKLVYEDSKWSIASDCFSSPKPCKLFTKEIIDFCEGTVCQE